MGVKELWKHLGYAERRVNMTEITANKVIGVDTSYLLHALVSRTVAAALYADKTESLVASFMWRVRQMRELNLQVILVLEGPTAPAKRAEKESRQQERDAARAEIERLKAAGESVPDKLYITVRRSSNVAAHCVCGSGGSHSARRDAPNT